MRVTTIKKAFASIMLAAAFVVACSSSSSSRPVGCTQGTYEVVTRYMSHSTCSCDTPSDPSFDNDVTCDQGTLGGDAVCSESSDQTECTCYGFACETLSMVVTCGYGINDDGTAPSTCTGGHFCQQNTKCTCQTAACATGEVELSSCTSDDTRSTLRASFNARTTGKIVTDCRAAVAAGSPPATTDGDSDAGGGTDTSTSGPKCKSAGPGLCADTPALNHCNCGAGCYRNSAQVGSGFSCHVACKTDADCDNFYSFATTCQPFTADGTTQAMECR